MNVAEFEALLSDVEVRLDRVRGLYEQYFQGVERLEPTIPRKEIDRRLAQLRRAQPRNTALRFRFQSLLQRYTTYKTYWKRVSRQIEEGTFRRDVLKARKRRGDAREARKEARQREREKAQAEAPGSYEIDIDVALDDFQAEAAPLPSPGPAAAQGAPRPAPRRPPSPKPPVPSPAAVKTVAAPPPRAAPPSSPKPPPRASAASRPTPPRPPPPAAAAPSTKVAPPPPARTQRKPPPPPNPKATAAKSRVRGPDGQRMEHIYETYVAARRRNNERTDNVRLETVAKSIQKMMPKLEQKHRGKKIDFEVVIKNGRVGLKPVAR